MLNELSALDGAVAAAPDESRNVIWVAETNAPGLTTVALDSGERNRVLTLDFTPSGISLSGDGSLVLLTGSDGTIAAVGADDPGNGATVLTNAAPESFGDAAATRPATGSGSALAASPTQGRVRAVSIDGGPLRTVATLNGISGIAALGSRIFVAATAGTGSVFRVQSGAASAIASGLLATGHLSVSPSGDHLLVAHPGADRVSVVTVADGSTKTAATENLSGSIVEIHELVDERIVLITDEVVAIADGFADLEVRPKLVAPAEPLFVGSWVKLQYDLSGTGLSPTDVMFRVADGPDVAIVSHTQTISPLGSHPETLLVAGGLLGTFQIEMVEEATGNVLDITTFDVTDHWHDPDRGPSAFFQGDSSESNGFDWGGGPNAPQNLNTRPHNGRWRVAVLMVNTASGSYPTTAAGLAAARKSILDHVQDGVSVAGTVRSARHYYEEVSGWNPNTNRGLTISALNNRVFGPVNLPGAWDTYFGQDKDGAGVVTDERWSSLGATVQTIVTRAFTDGVLTTADYSNIDVLLIVPFSPDTVAGTTTKRFVWPHASAAQTFLAGTNVATDQRSFGYIFVPPDFDVHDGRQVYATLSHEIGHTLGLPDLYSFPSYTADVVNRLTMNWDMMAGSRNDMPHYSLSNRMRQGWVQPNQLRLFNFAVSGSVNQNVTLSASNITTPPPGRVRGIEMRLSDGWNTYIEYRAKQPGHVADTLPSDRRVVITDVTSDNFVAATSRPPILFVHNDADGDGPILDTNNDYEDIDPSSQKNLVVKVVSTAADNAVVNVTYGSNGRPDPGIRPWSGPPNWQSPDIEVRNAKTMADPGRWANTPWLDNLNTVVAKIRNNGDLLAKGVTIDFFVIPYTTGEGPMTLLGTDVKDIGPLSTVEFSTSWSPPSNTEQPHFCIVARIRLYQDPNIAGLLETNIFNNEARSNYTRFWSASASPSTRISAQVDLANPFDDSSIVHAIVRSGHPFHRVFVDHRWLRVDGRASRSINIYDEALAGFADTGTGIATGDIEGLLYDNDQVVSVEGWAKRPFEADCGALTLTGGASLRVSAGRQTDIEIYEAQRSYMSGRVFHVNDGSPVSGGTVLIVGREVDEFGDTTTGQGELDNGEFTIEFNGMLPGDVQTGEAHFLGWFGSAACESSVVALA